MRTATTPSTGRPSPSHRCRPSSPARARTADRPFSTRLTDYIAEPVQRTSRDATSWRKSRQLAAASSDRPSTVAYVASAAVSGAASIATWKTWATIDFEHDRESAYVEDLRSTHTELFTCDGGPFWCPRPANASGHGGPIPPRVRAAADSPARGGPLPCRPGLRRAMVMALVARFGDGGGPPRPNPARLIVPDRRHVPVQRRARRMAVACLPLVNASRTRLQRDRRASGLR